MNFEMSPFGRVVWEDRYGLKDASGNLIEKDIFENFKRVAKALASKENNPQLWEENFYEIMSQRYYCPAGRILAHSGTHYSQLLNCFVLPFESDSLEAIMDAAKRMAIIEKFGGGCGFNYGTLRPSGSYIKGVNGRSCGVMGFMHMMSTASEVIEQGGCLTEDILINTKKGLLYFKEIIQDKSIGWHDHFLHIKTKDGDEISDRYYVNGFVNTIKIETSIGTEINGTPNHKLYVFNGGKFEWKEIKDIKKGDFLVYKMGQYEGVRQALNTEVALNIHHNCVIPEKLPEVIDPDFAFLLGYMQGNGFSTTKEDDYRVGVTIPMKSYLINEITSMFHNIFGPSITVNKSQKSNDESTTFYISNKIIKAFLFNNGLLKGKSLTSCVPEKIRCSERDILCFYLSGLFESDGSITHGYPQYSSSSLKLIKEIHVLLLGLGIPSVFFKVKRGPLSSRFSNKPMYIVKVVSYKGLEIWNKLIQHDSRSRFMACRNFKPDLNKEKAYILPCINFWLSEALKYAEEMENRDPYLIKSIRRYLRGDRNFSLSSYKRLVEKYPYIEKTLPAVDNLFFAEVVSVSDDNNSTYDIEVKGSHSYLANGVISHNSRRGANLGLLEISHPDIWEYISYKTEHNWDKLKEFVEVKNEAEWASFKFENSYKLQMYNISVGVSDQFFEALKKNENWLLMWKGTEWELYTVEFRKSGEKTPSKKLEAVADCDKTALWKVKKKIPYPSSKDTFTVVSKRKITAAELWEKICYNAWADGCPGLINLSTTRKFHNLEYVHPLTSANPCGEQQLPDFGSCNLSSILLDSFYVNGIIDKEALKKTIHTAVRMADNVIDNCEFPIPEIKRVALEERRIGIGTMGVHDLLIAMQLGYDTQEARDVVDRLLRFIRDEAYRASINLAKEKGPFPLFNKEAYLKSAFIQTLPQDIQEDIALYGIRNSCLLSQAPTGTISTLFNASSGCEPWFSLCLERNTRLGSYEDGCSGYIKWRKDHPDEPIPSYFKTAQDISPKDHIEMMILFSKYVDSAVSKTINLPNTATVKDISDAYIYAMERGVKGITVFRDGSKDAVLISKDKKAPPPEVAHEIEIKTINPEIPLDTRILPKKRGNRAVGATYRVHLQSHNLYVTANRNADGELVEIFATVGESKKPNAYQTSGVEDSWAEGLGKIISLALRAGVKPQSITKNLKNIPSDKPVFTTIGDIETSELIPSPPHAIARVIEEESKYRVHQDHHLDAPQEDKRCRECGSPHLKSKSPTCYECLDCGYSGCGG